MMKALSIFVFAFLFASAAAHAQECRTPTARERAAILKAVNALQQTVAAPLLSSGWSIASNQSALTKQIVVAANAAPPRPIFDCSTEWDVTLAAAAGNPRADAARQAMQQITGTSSQGEIKRIAAIMAAASIHFRAGLNEPSWPDGDHSTVTRMKIPGATLAFQVAGRDPGTVTTTMCFGRLPFRHGPGTPYIENLCLSVHTANSVSRDLLKQIKWSALNQALTP